LEPLFKNVVKSPERKRAAKTSLGLVYVAASADDDVADVE
jgi:hypothetical protein